MSQYLNHEEINSTITQNLNDVYEYNNRFGFATIGVRVVPPTDGEVVFEGSYEGSSWFPLLFKEATGNTYISSTSTPCNVSTDITGLSYIRFRVTQAGSASGSIVGRVQIQQSRNSIDATIRGASDKTPIGNDGDSLKVTKSGRDPDDALVNARSSGVSSLNSTSEPLGISGTYTGTFENVVGYTNIALSVFSDQDSAIDGIIIEYSSNGVNVDSNEVFTLTANNGTQYSFGVLTKYVRIRYINGSSAQSEFRLQTIYHTSAPKASSHRIAEPITGQNDAELVKSVITGQREDGLFSNVGLSNSNSSRVAITDRPSEVRNRTHISIPILDTTLAPAGTVIYTVTEGKTLYIQSFLVTQLNTSANDGNWTINDNTTVKSAFLVPARSGGSTPGAASNSSPTMPEPMQFTTNVRLVEIAGDLRVAGYLIGYEEDN